MNRISKMYVNPKICAHREFRISLSVSNTGGFKEYYTAKCDTCGFEGEPIEVKTFTFLAKNKAARSFFKLANEVDER